MIRSQFEAAGYDVVPFGRKCEVVVVHGCTVTQKAHRESLRLARSAKRGKAAPFVVLAGCAAVAPGSGAEGTDDAGALCADLLANQVDKFSLPAILRQRLEAFQARDSDGCDEADPSGRETNRSAGIKRCRASSPPASLPLPRFTTVRARVKVQDGCDCRCAYCIVPHVRGPSTSRPFREIVDEVSRLGDAGFKEIILTGVNLGCYMDGTRRLVHLLDAIHKLDTVARIRLSSIEPGTSEMAVIDFMADAPKICRHLHMPLQSGHDGMLARMGRAYTVAGFRHAVDHALEKLGHIGLGTDLITGLPGEDDEAFEATCRMALELPFTNIHVFPYSKRPGTRAATMPGQVPEAVRKERAKRLLKLGASAKKTFSAGCVGRQVSVLVEHAEGKGRGTGWTSEYVRARVAGTGIARNQVITGVAARFERGLLQVDCRRQA